jgi:hypothetical protein
VGCVSVWVAFWVFLGGKLECNGNPDTPSIRVFRSDHTQKPTSLAPNHQVVPSAVCSHPRNDRMRIVVNKRQIRYIFLLLKNIDFLVRHSGGIRAKQEIFLKIGRTTSNTHQIMGMWKCATENGNDEASHFWVCVDKLFCSIYGGGRHLTPLILGPLVQVSHQVMRLCIKLFFFGLFLTERVKPL